MGRTVGRIKANVIFSALPEEAVVKEELMHLIYFVFLDIKFLEGNLQPSFLHIVGIQVYRHQDDIGKVLRALAVEEQLFIIHGIKGQPSI
jgi:hypothetical protein